MFQAISNLLDRRRPTTRTAKLADLREYGRPAGATWLRSVLQAHRVELLSHLPEPAIDCLLATFEAGIARGEAG